MTRDDNERIENLRQALSDIAQGLIPPSFNLEGPRDEVRGRLWEWSQQRASTALKEDTDIAETAESYEHARS